MTRYTRANMISASSFSKCIAAGLAFSVFTATCLAAAPEAQNPSDRAAAKAQRQIEKLQERDFLRVKLSDRSELQGCLKGSEADGFLLAEPGGSERKILYKDVAELNRVKPLGLLKRVVSVVTLGGIIFGTVKIGSNTPKTVLVKTQVGPAVGLIVLSGLGASHSPPPCP